MPLSSTHLLPMCCPQSVTHVLSPSREGSVLALWVQRQGNSLGPPLPAPLLPRGRRGSRVSRGNFLNSTPVHPGPLPSRCDGATARRVGRGEGESSAALRQAEVQGQEATMSGTRSCPRHPVAAGILPAVEGGILPPGPTPERRRTAIPPGKMPGSTAGRMPAATVPSGGSAEMRPPPHPNRLPA
jgi:hypothetical protein